jgi:hypothetical protein
VSKGDNKDDDYDGGGGGDDDYDTVWLQEAQTYQLQTFRLC